MSDQGQERVGLYTLKWEAWTDYERVTLARIEIHAGGGHVMHARASAVCHPDDRFNKTVGQRLAIARATAKCFDHLDASLAQLHKTVSKLKRAAYDTVNEASKPRIEQDRRSFITEVIGIPLGERGFEAYQPRHSRG